MNQTTISFGPNGTSSKVTSEVLRSNWFTKKAPTKLAKSRRRFFEMYPSEICYFVDDVAFAEKKGSIKLCNETVARAEGRNLIVSNPDREWCLTADNVPNAGDTIVQVWADAINEAPWAKADEAYAYDTKPSAASASAASADGPAAAQQSSEADSDLGGFSGFGFDNDSDGDDLAVDANDDDEGDDDL